MLPSRAWHTRLSPDCCLDPLRLARARVIVEALSIRESSGGQAASVEGPVEALGGGPWGVPMHRARGLQGGADEERGVLGTDHSRVWGQRGTPVRAGMELPWAFHQPRTSKAHGSPAKELFMIATHFTEKETEAQSGQMTNLRLVAKLRFSPRTV